MTNTMEELLIEKVEILELLINVLLRSIDRLGSGKKILILGAKSYKVVRTLPQFKATNEPAPPDPDQPHIAGYFGEMTVIVSGLSSDPDSKELLLILRATPTPTEAPLVWSNYMPHIQSTRRYKVMHDGHSLVIEAPSFGVAVEYYLASCGMFGWNGDLTYQITEESISEHCSLEELVPYFPKGFGPEELRKLDEHHKNAIEIKE
jgi:hypothetical protein